MSGAELLKVLRLLLVLEPVPARANAMEHDASSNRDGDTVARNSLHFNGTRIGKPGATKQDLVSSFTLHIFKLHGLRHAYDGLT